MMSAQSAGGGDGGNRTHVLERLSFNFIQQ
jgi:hypothetical protein